MIPKPFKRPSVEIGVRVTRRWVDTEVGNLSKGDIVQDRGLVVSLTPIAPSSTGWVIVGYASGQTEPFWRGETIRAFTEGARVGNIE